jgi:PAT family acetyl-CoA transporter-like MFS transporter 1
MSTFIVILMLAKIGFICNEAVTGLKLLELGFSKEDLALAVLIDFPFQILFGYYAARWSGGPKPLQPV